MKTAEETKPGTKAAKDNQPKDHTVIISGAGFNPARLECKAGDTVTWTNTESAKHSVKFADGSGGSGGILMNKSWSRTFDKAGTFDYECESNTNLRGTVVVN